jgi:hypothetical protein
MTFLCRKAQLNESANNSVEDIVAGAPNPHAGRSIKEMKHMKYITCLILACLVSGCANRSVPDYSAVPASVPDEAKPVWVMLDAAQKSDLDVLLSVCTSEKESEVKRAPTADVFKELTELIPQGGIDTVDLRVSRSLTEVSAVLGLPAGGKNLVARPGFAWVLIGSTTGLPVVQRDGLWLIEANLINQKENWIEQVAAPLPSEGAPSDGNGQNSVMGEDE